ncbi:type VI secretion system-associated protein TagO [Kaistia hirudinis]
MLAAIASHSWAADNDAKIRKCSAVENGLERLACFDELAASLNAAADQKASAAAAASPEDKGQWRQLIEASKVDDSTTVILNLASKGSIIDRFGRRHDPTLTIRCMEKVTVLYWTFGDLFVADSGGFGEVTIRLDREKARSLRTDESTDHRSLGLWTGGQTIPLIRSMLDNETMLVRMTPYSESAMEMEFDIRGLAAAVKPLQAACGWSAVAKPKAAAN